MNTEHTIENQLALPVIETIGTDSISFPRLDLDDLIPWTAEARNARRIEADQRFKADTSLSPYDRHRLLQEVIDRGIELSILLDKAFEPPGIRKVLVMSLKKSGKNDADALAILKRIHFSRQAVLAHIVLSPPAPAAEPAPKDAEKKDGEPPLSDSTGA